MTTYLRPYQTDALEAIQSSLSQNDSTLCVLPTGCGKTEVALELADQWDTEVLFLAHRQELVYQPAARWEKKTGEYAEVVMGEYNASNTMNRGRFICGSVPTLRQEHRLRRAFPDPNSVGLIILDEAHHAVKRKNKSYGTILDYFDGAKVLGITATPDRTDEEALGQTFESVAFEYPMFDPDGGPSAIGDGWLVPINQQYVVVEGLELDVVKNRGGDFIDSDLERQLKMESALHRVAEPTRELCGDRKAVIFAAGIEHAIGLAEVLNRRENDCAATMASRVPADQAHEWVVNSGDREARRRLLQRYRRGEFQYLTNMAIFTEGWDEPTVGAIACARPTKSRSLYAQIIGRGTRVLPGTIEGFDDGTFWRIDSATERKQRIADSGKPNILIVDVVGNSRHPLMTSADILGGKYSDEVVAEAKESLQKSGGDPERALKEADKRIQMALEQRKRLRTKATYQAMQRDPFATIGASPRREPGWHKGRKPTSKQRSALLKFGVSEQHVDDMSFWAASQMMDKLVQRIEANQCSYKQAKLLAKFGFDTDVGFQEASAIIDRIAKSNWKLRGDTA